MSESLVQLATSVVQLVTAVVALIAAVVVAKTLCATSVHLWTSNRAVKLISTSAEENEAPLGLTTSNALSAATVRFDEYGDSDCASTSTGF